VDKKITKSQAFEVYPGSTRTPQHHVPRRCSL